MGRPGERRGFRRGFERAAAAKPLGVGGAVVVGALVAAYGVDDADGEIVSHESVSAV
jgi:hypothetical protein